MDELTNLAALLLVHNLQHLPSLSCLRLELLVGHTASKTHYGTAKRLGKVVGQLQPCCA